MQHEDRTLWLQAFICSGWANPSSKGCLLQAANLPSRVEICQAACPGLAGDNSLVSWRGWTESVGRRCWSWGIRKGGLRTLGRAGSEQRYRHFDAKPKSGECEALAQVRFRAILHSTLKKCFRHCEDVLTAACKVLALFLLALLPLHVPCRPAVCCLALWPMWHWHSSLRALTACPSLQLLHFQAAVVQNKSMKVWRPSMGLLKESCMETDMAQALTLMKGQMLFFSLWHKLIPNAA